MQRNESAGYDPVKKIKDKLDQLINLPGLNPQPKTDDSLFDHFLFKELIAQRMKRRDVKLHNDIFQKFIQNTLNIYNKQNLSWHKSWSSWCLESTLKSDTIALSDKLTQLSEYTKNPSNSGRNLYKSIQQAEEQTITAIDYYVSTHGLSPKSAEKVKSLTLGT